MSIRVKLYLSYLLMIVILPIILICTVMVLLLFFTDSKQDVRDYFEKEKNLDYRQALAIGEVSYVVQNEPDKLGDEAYVSNVQDKLGRVAVGLLIARNGEMESVSPYLQRLSPQENWSKLLISPPKRMTYNHYPFTSDSIAFRYSDGSEGEAILLRRYESVPVYWHPISLVVVLAIIGLTSLLLTYYVSRRIIKPIEALKTGVQHIKDGDLTYQVIPTSKDEVGELSKVFEEMRLRLKHSIEQTLQYEDNRKMLLSHISHDLKTPITAIKGYVEGILDGVANTEEKQDRYIRTIYRKANEMDKLIDELFLFSKLDVQTVAYDFIPLDVNSFTADMVGEMKFDLDKTGITLTTSLPPETIMVVADPEKLSRVLTNVIDNSVKYMDLQSQLQVKSSLQENKAITVLVHANDEEAFITVEDTGPGIEEEALPYIFDRFYRAEQSRNSETGGSGLGLAIVKQMVEGHGGRVWAENRPEGGARLTFTLPRAGA